LLQTKSGCSKTNLNFAARENSRLVLAQRLRIRTDACVAQIAILFATLAYLEQRFLAKYGRTVQLTKLVLNVELKVQSVTWCE